MTPDNQERVRDEVDGMAQISTSSGQSLSFTGMHLPCREDDTVTMKRAIQRVLNARLLAALAAAHSTTVRAVLKEVHVLPPRGNAWPTNGVGLEEFLHNSDRGTLSSDVLRLATDLCSDEPSEMLRNIATEVVQAIGKIRSRTGEADRKGATTL